MLLQINASVSRAQEYSADRGREPARSRGRDGHGQPLRRQAHEQARDVDAYFESVADHEGGFWLKVANFRADHAVGFRRMSALRRVEAEGWDVHGRML